MKIESSPNVPGVGKTASVMDKDFTPSGVKIEGAYENDRNANSNKLFKDIVREAFGVTDVIVGHHLVYEKNDKRADGFTYQVIEEIPSADALLFDHDVAAKIWGPNFRVYLIKLAMEPVATRDQMLNLLYYSRGTELK
jgi:hypothetical protein